MSPQWWDDCSAISYAASLLRPGSISLAELNGVIGEEAVLLTEPDPAMRAPGSHASHYAPLTSTAVVSGEQLALIAGRFNSARKTVAILCLSTMVPIFSREADCTLMPGGPAGYGRDLYATLRRLDAAGYDSILIETPPETEPWRAVRDRIRRAAHGQPETQQV